MLPSDEIDKLPDKEIPEKIKILVIDDDQSILRVLEAHLQNDGYDTVTAGDGITALAVAHRESPDLILLDLVLPHLDGIKVCKKLKESEKFSNVPIILLTSKTDTNLKVEALKAGANDYVTKPFELDELKARVESHLKTKLLQDQVEEMQSSLVTAGKRDAIIELAGATAHEINQPLTAILGRIALLERRIEKESPYVKDLETIREQSERLSRIVQKLAKVSKYDTKHYVGEQKILDLEKVSKNEIFPDLRSKVLVTSGGEASLERFSNQLSIKNVLVQTPKSAADLEIAWIESKPDAMILDTTSSSWPGLEALDKIKKDSKLQFLPVMIIFRQSEGVLKKEAIARGYIDCVTLPLEDEDFISRVLSLCRLAGVSKKAADMEEEVRKTQVTDKLTGLFNRRHFYNLLRSELRRAKRYKYPLSVALVDVDNFFDINKKCGMDFGDTALKELSLILKGTTREVDLIGRYGGEEFSIILPHTTPEASATAVDRIKDQILGNGLSIAEEMRKSVEQYTFEKAEIAAKMTVSIGIAGIIPGDEVEEDDILRQCEEALSKAKLNGKNRIVIYGKD